MTLDSPKSVNQILHDFGVTYRVLIKEERQEDIAKAKAKLRQLLLAGVPKEKSLLADLAYQGPDIPKKYKEEMIKYKGFNTCRQEFLDFVNRITE